MGHLVVALRTGSLYAKLVRDIFNRVRGIVSFKIHIYIIILSYNISIYLYIIIIHI